MEDILHQLIGIVCPIFYKVFFTSLVVQGYSTNSIIKPPTWHSLDKRWDLLYDIFASIDPVKFNHSWIGTAFIH